MDLKKPKAVLDAEKRLEAAETALAEREDVVAQEVAAIAEERARLAMPWSAREQRAERDARTRRERSAVTVAERGIERAWKAAAPDYAPQVADALEDAVAAALAANDELEAALRRVQTLRALLDDLENAPKAWRGFVARHPNGRPLPTLPNTHPHTIAERVRLMLSHARPVERAKFMALGDSVKRRRLARIAAIEAATDYASVQAALHTDPVLDGPARARVGSW